MATLSTYSTAGTAAQTGDVVQVDTTTYINNGAHISTSSTSAASTGISATITPTSAANSILIEVSSDMCYGYDTSHLTWALYRSGDGVSNGYVIPWNGTHPNYYGWTYISASEWHANNNMFIDTTHNTTSTLTYTLYHKIFSGSSTNYTAHQGHPVHFILTEVQA